MRILIIFVFLFGFLFASVDINNANEKEFLSLNGVGIKKAERIVAFRLKNGCFKSIADLSRVKGIGKKIMEKNKENLILGDCKK